MSNQNTEQNKAEANDESGQSDINSARRDAMDRLGKLGLLTSPAMLSLMLSDKATAASHLGGPPPPPSM